MDLEQASTVADSDDAWDADAVSDAVSVEQEQQLELEAAEAELDVNKAPSDVKRFEKYQKSFKLWNMALLSLYIH